jgi:hypothetical protein
MRTASSIFTRSDAVPDGWRDALPYPFITGLAGTAASPEVEDAREAYIVGEVYRLGSARGPI